MRKSEESPQNRKSGTSYQDEENNRLNSIRRKPKVNASCFITLLPASDPCAILANEKNPSNVSGTVISPSFFPACVLLRISAVIFVYSDRNQNFPKTLLHAPGRCLRNQGRALLYSSGQSRSWPFPIAKQHSQSGSSSSSYFCYKVKIKIFSRGSKTVYL